MKLSAADNLYSRFVQFAKIVMPIIALGLLSTMFLFTRSIDLTEGIDTAKFDVEKVAREQRLAAPKFSGVTEDGSEVYLTAESATPDPENSRRFLANDVHAEINAPTGLVYDITANMADYNGDDDSLTLDGNVVIITSSGYRLQTEKLITNIGETKLNVPQDIQGQGPDGTIRANSLNLETRDRSQVLVFKGDVKLIYQPKE